MSWDYRFGALILLSTLIDYFVGLQLSKTESTFKRKLYLYFSLITNLVLILGFFKYYNFFATTVNQVTGIWSSPETLPILQIILPAGISFFTFQSLSYTIDLYRREIPVEKDFLNFALFVSFFPQLVAGPIVMAKTFLPQLFERKHLESIEFRVGIRMFLLGYFKKAVLSDQIAPTIDAIFANPNGHNTGALWIGAVLGIVQVYLDFSGYSDMAIGSAKLLGYQLPENFKLPFIATSISEFWRRWHMTLNSWLRDYIYIPLGGSRVSSVRRKWNLWFTMFVSGFWHGADWTYIFWGSWNGLFYVAEEVVRPPEKRKQLRPWAWILLNLFTCTVCFMGAVFFRSHSLSNAFDHLYGMFTIKEGVLRPYMWKHFLWTVFFLAFGHYLGYLIFEKKKFFAPPAYIEFALLPFVILILSLFTPDNSLPFIYFQF